MANIHDISRDAFMLNGPLGRKGYDWWWHSFTGYNEKTGIAKPFFIEFFTCNPALGGDQVIFGENGKHKPSYMMVKCGAWTDNPAQLHRFFTWKQTKINAGIPFQINAENCYLSETETTGEVIVQKEYAAKHPEWMSDAGSMKWNLHIHKKIAFHVGYGASSFFRRLNSFEMFWHAEGMKTEYEGWVEWNGEKYLVRPQDCYGYADKNWGSDFTSPWVWLSSCSLTSEITGRKLKNSVFDIGGGQPKAFGIAMKRKLLSAFFYEGKDYEFNFSKFWTHTKTAFECHETDTQIIWHVEQETTKAVMITNITCEKKDMLLVNYESPDGMKRHNRLWNGGNGTGTVVLYEKHNGAKELIDRIHVENAGCEYGEYTN